MKKLFLIGCLILTTACQTATSTLVAESTPATTLQTPPAPATATVTFTPATTLTPTPVPLYFTEEFNTDMSAWSSFQTGGETSPSVSIGNDQLRLSISSPNTWYYAIHNAHEYDDVFVSAKFSGSPSGSMGLICRYSEKGWYEFNVASDGTYNILLGQWLGDGIAQYRPIKNDTTEYLKRGNLDYEIGLTCQGDIMLLYINRKLFRKLDISSYGLERGKIGITTSSFDDVPMSASFDWVKVSQP